MNTEPLLALQNLAVSVEEKPILHALNLQVNQGETHVLMGPNGAGKSTLGHVIMGDPSYTITEGTIRFDGTDITDLSPDKRSQLGLFLSFQAPVEIPGVPISSYLRAICENRPGVGALKGKQFRKHIHAIAESLDMDPAFLDRELGVGFSGGEKKKLEMLQLLLLQPKLAILDETDSGLDVDALTVVSKGIEAYKAGADNTLIIITHNTRILKHVQVDAVEVLSQGQLAAHGDASLITSIDAHGYEQFNSSELLRMAC